MQKCYNVAFTSFSIYILISIYSDLFTFQFKRDYTNNKISVLKTYSMMPQRDLYQNKTENKALYTITAQRTFKLIP